MLRRDPSSIFRSILILSAVGACGGAVESQIGSGPTTSEPSNDATSTGGSSSSSGGSRKQNTSSSGGSTSSSGFTSSSGGSTSSSGGTSTSSSGGTSTSSSGGNWSCINGVTPMTDAYCCAEGKTCFNSGSGGDTSDGGTCTIDCEAICNVVAPGVQGGFQSCWPATDGGVSYLCGACGVGRLPSDTKPCPVGETLGERLARQAYYEGVSVVAFERLASVLASHGAPESLVARARRAADDEARHAAIFGELAREHGASVPALVLADVEQTLLDLAIENATEGCVRETLGAVITMHQAEHAESEAVRAAFAAICDDEAEHAAFSWELKAWFDEQLDAAGRARVEEAHHAALASAQLEAGDGPDATGLALGLPSSDRTRRMLDLAVEAMSAAA